jgi:hypothetical protein
VKESTGEGTPALDTCSFVPQAVSRFGEPTPGVLRILDERRLRATQQPTRKPGAVRRPELGGGRAWWDRVEATAAPAEGPANDDGGKPQRRLSVDGAGVGWSA